MNGIKRRYSTSFQLVDLHVRSDGAGRLDRDDRDNPTPCSLASQSLITNHNTRRDVSLPLRC